ncbi:hypothetical protein NM208_g9989 [Fusarium decemcellulare]|uniref:Uncharacterized protein n=1 Tax=Fusarium decemcellulare TaxID=57161 RepID=A0ACC1RZH2_9HYPO|nr:hypothetical protein NM208_g9989 [Fusarium decemcellulare]
MVPPVKYAVRGHHEYRNFLYNSARHPVETGREGFRFDTTATKVPSPYKPATAGNNQQMSLVKIADDTWTRDTTAYFHNESEDSMFKLSAYHQGHVAKIKREKKRAGSAVTFLTDVFEDATLLAGKSTVQLFVPLHGTSDADFLPVAVGYQRVSKRKIDTSISTEDFVHLDCQMEEPIEEGRVVELKFNLAPITVAVEKGGRLMVEI